MGFMLYFVVLVCWVIMVGGWVDFVMWVYVWDVFVIPSLFSVIEFCYCVFRVCLVFCVVCVGRCVF